MIEYQKYKIAAHNGQESDFESEKYVKFFIEIA